MSLCQKTPGMGQGPEQLLGGDTAGVTCEVTVIRVFYRGQEGAARTEISVPAGVRGGGAGF